MPLSIRPSVAMRRADQALGERLDSISRSSIDPAIQCRGIDRRVSGPLKTRPPHRPPGTADDGRRGAATSPPPYPLMPTIPTRIDFGSPLLASSSNACSRIMLRSMCNAASAARRPTRDHAAGPEANPQSRSSVARARGPNRSRTELRFWPPRFAAALHLLARRSPGGKRRSI